MGKVYRGIKKKAKGAKKAENAAPVFLGRLPKEEGRRVIKVQSARERSGEPFRIVRRHEKPNEVLGKGSSNVGVEKGRKGRKSLGARKGVKG